MFKFTLPKSAPTPWQKRKKLIGGSGQPLKVGLIFPKITSTRHAQQGMTADRYPSRSGYSEFGVQVVHFHW